MLERRDPCGSRVASGSGRKDCNQGHAMIWLMCFVNSKMEPNLLALMAALVFLDGISWDLLYLRLLPCLRSLFKANLKAFRAMLDYSILECLTYS